jgi:hypothetical protein
MVAFDEIRSKLLYMIEHNFDEKFHSTLLEALDNLPPEQQERFADQVNPHFMLTAPETTGSTCPLEGSTFTRLQDLYIYRAAWHVCCHEKDHGEILSVDSPCINVLFVCLRMEAEYDIAYVLSYFNSETPHLCKAKRPCLPRSKMP